MRKIKVALLAAVILSGMWPAALLSGPSMAPVVVELYTSQGCSSCPPADDLLAELSDRDGVIPLALHVDYWDYIGWKDVFGRPQNTARQKAYARNAGRKMIYTPQMIIGGVADVVGANPTAVLDGISKVQNARSPVSMEVSRTGGRLRITASASGQTPAKMSVQLVRYMPEKTVTITRGENAGLTMKYSNIVTDWREIATWNGRSDLDLSEAISGSAPMVVIIQEDGPGRILAAARLR